MDHHKPRCLRLNTRSIKNTLEIKEYMRWDRTEVSEVKRAQRKKQLKNEKHTSEGSNRGLASSWRVQCKTQRLRHANPRQCSDGGGRWFPPSSPMKPAALTNKNFQKWTNYISLEPSRNVDHESHTHLA